MNFIRASGLPSRSCQSPLPSTESMSRTDSPSKIIKLDTVRVIAEKVSKALLWVPFHGWGNRGPGLQPVLAPHPASVVFPLLEAL